LGISDGRGQCLGHGRLHRGGLHAHGRADYGRRRGRSVEHTLWQADFSVFHLGQAGTAGVHGGKQQRQPCRAVQEGYGNICMEKVPLFFENPCILCMGLVCLNG